VTIAIKNLKPGDVVYDVRREKMGNTTISHPVCRAVTILSVDTVRESVEASWNGNSAQTFRARNGGFSWRRSKPTTSR